MNCAETIDLMGDAIEGSLASDLRGGFDEHIEECAACRTYLEQLHLTKRTLESLPREGDSSPHRAELIEEFKREFEGEN